MFVVSTMIYQRFSPLNWGLMQRDPTRIDVEDMRYYVEDYIPLNQLFGRRPAVMTVYAQPIEPDNGCDTSGTASTSLRRSPRHNLQSPSTQVPNAAEGQPAPEEGDVETQPEPLCAKVNWTEANRVPEPAIVAEAAERAATRLPEAARRMVLDHLPEIIKWEPHEETNTYETALHAKLAGNPMGASVEEIMNQGRILIVMVSRMLQNVR